MLLNKLTVVLILQLFVIHGRPSAEDSIKCNSTGEILKPPRNIITVQGENIQFNCSVQGNLTASDTSKFLTSHWEVKFPPAKQYIPIYIYGNYTDSFFMALYQTCLTDNGSCCNFLSRLTIQNVPLEYNETTISCIEYLHKRGEEPITNEKNAMLTVFTTPKIINSSASEVCTTLNDSVKIYCTFNASTMDGATIIVWLKNHSVISGYDNETKPVENNIILSVLNIKNFTDKDQGEYSCYCYYNQSMITSNKPVTSDCATVNVHTDCTCANGKENNIPWMWVIISGTILALVIVIVSSVICAVICVKHRRSSNDRDNVTSTTSTTRVVANPNTENASSPPTELATANHVRATPIPIDCSHHHGSNSARTVSPIQIAEKTPLNQPDYTKQDYGASNNTHHEISKQKHTHLTNSNSLHTECAPDGQLPPPLLSSNDPTASGSQTPKPDESTKTKPSAVEQQTSKPATSGASSIERLPVEASDGSSNKKNALAAQPPNTLSQEIHNHQTLLIHGNVQINSLSLGPAQREQEQLTHDPDNFANPILRQHATDFKQLVSTEILAVVLFQNALLTQDEYEHLQLPMTESKKVEYVYLKMVRLGEEDVKKFLSCLKDPYAMQHAGHIKLHDILSTSQQ